MSDILENIREESNGAQIIFASHNLISFNGMIVSPEELHIIEKRCGESSVSRLDANNKFTKEKWERLTELWREYLSMWIDFDANPQIILKIKENNK